MAARAATRPELPLAALAAELRDAARPPGRASTAATRPPTCGRCSPGRTGRCGAAAARLFRLLGLHPGPDIGAAAAASLAGVPAARAAPLLAELTGAHLLTEHTPGRYAFHDLLRAYAAELRRRATTPRPSGGRAVHRLLDHYLHTAAAASRAARPARRRGSPRRRPGRA